MSRNTIFIFLKNTFFLLFLWELWDIVVRSYSFWLITTSNRKNTFGKVSSR